MPGIKDVIDLMASKVGAELNVNDPSKFEISDEEFDQLENKVNGLMTIDAATNNTIVAEKLKEKLKEDLKKDIFSEAKSHALSGVEKQARSIAKKIGLEFGQDDNADQMLQKISKQADALTGNADERVLSITKENDSLHKSISRLKESREKEKQQYQQQLNSLQIKNDLDRHIDSYPFDSRTKKDGILMNGIRVAVDQVLEAKATLKREDGRLVPYRKDQPELRLFDDKTNKEMELEDLIGPIVQPYLQATPPASQGSQQNTQTQAANVKPQYGNDAAGLMRMARRDNGIGVIEGNN